MSFLSLFFSGVVSLCFPRKLSSQNHIPFRRSFSCKSEKQKADTQRHQKSAEVLLSLQNDVLCNGFEIQRRDCLFICSLADSTKKHRVQTVVFSLSIPQALGGLHRIPNPNILYSVVVLKRDFIIPKPSPKIKFFPARVCIGFVKMGNTNSLKTVNENFKHKYRKFVRVFYCKPACSVIE